MSIIRPGPWELRFLIVNTKLNELLFLTSNGIGNVVTVEPQNLTPSDRQKWFARLVEGKNNLYQIIQDPASFCPPGLARAKDSNDVILSNQPGEWYLELVPINLAGGNVYKIYPTPEFLPVVQVLGKELEGPKVVVETLSNPFPAWQFSDKIN